MVPPPVRQPYDGAFIHRVELLKDWRKQVARELSVESDVVLPRDILEEIARKNPPSMSSLSNVMEITPWRFQQYGETIFNLIRKH